DSERNTFATLVGPQMDPFGWKSTCSAYVRATGRAQARSKSAASLYSCVVAMDTTAYVGGKKMARPTKAAGRARTTSRTPRARSRRRRVRVILPRNHTWRRASCALFSYGIALAGLPLSGPQGLVYLAAAAGTPA